VSAHPEEPKKFGSCELWIRNHGANTDSGFENTFAMAETWGGTYCLVHRTRLGNDCAGNYEWSPPGSQEARSETGHLASVVPYGCQWWSDHYVKRDGTGDFLCIRMLFGGIPGNRDAKTIDGTDARTGACRSAYVDESDVPPVEPVECPRPADGVCDVINPSEK
jgi:hypothetical protein